MERRFRMDKRILEFMTKKLMTRRASAPTTMYLKIQDIVHSEYNLSLSEVEDMVAKRDKNGLAECGKLIGRRFFIEKEKFEEWLKNTD